MQTYRISAQEAAMRLGLETRVARLTEQLASENPGDFGGVWIEHEPVYKIVVAFKNAETRSAIRDTIEPELRRHVQIKNVRTSVAEREQISDRIIAALSALGIQYISYYEHKTDDMVIEVGSDDKIGAVRQALPSDLQSSVKVQRGSIPVRKQASNYLAGDEIYGGFWWSATSGGGYMCSFAFAAKDNQNRLGILTAAHCPNTAAYIYDVTPSAHWIRLAPATINWNAPNTKYDYRFYLVTGITTAGWVYYDNSSTKIKGTDYGQSISSYSSQNVVANFATGTGWFKVIGTYGYYSQVVGNVICKSGHSSGLTCGEITHGYYTFNGAKGWIETGRSAQYYFAIAGDSGAAVFTNPNANGEMKAAGIMAASSVYDPTLNPDGTSNNSGDERECSNAMEGNSNYDSNLYPNVAQHQDCKMIHMPIDYIDDQQLLTIATLPAT